MDKLMSIVSAFTHGKQRRVNTDDFSDRLAYRYTSTMLITFAAIISTKHYVGEPMHCWVPAHFTGNNDKYVNNYCWVSNTYYLPLDENVPTDKSARDDLKLRYYQWIPLILLTQAMLFYIPSAIWHAFKEKSGMGIHMILTACNGVATAESSEEQRNYLTLAVNRFNAYISFRNKMAFNGKSGMRRRSNYVTILYALTKLLNLTNVIGQFIVLNVFFGTIADDKSTIFPYVTMCDILIRRLGNPQTYTLQCVLPINMFMEVIYVVVWLWFVIVAISTLSSIIMWTIRLTVLKHRYIAKHVDDSKLTDYLKSDGLLLVHLIGHNTDTMTVSEFIGMLNPLR